MSVSKFQSDISRTEGMPPIIINRMDQKALGSYIVWQNERFAVFCKAGKHDTSKFAVQHRNLQADGRTYCFGPDLFFKVEKGSAIPVRPEKTDFVWIQSLLKGVTPLIIYQNEAEMDILEVIRQKLADDGMPDGTFISVLLICGYACILALHYKEVMTIFKKVPGLVVTGRRNTGKTFSTESAISFLGTNAEDICVAKDTTLAKLRERYTKDHFPLLINDCEDFSTVATALMECFEGKCVMDCSKESIPGTSVIFTCNERQTDYLQNRFEALSRAAVVSMIEEFKPMSDMQQENITKARETASRHFPALVNLTETDKDFLRKRAYDVRGAIGAQLPGVTDCYHRISENYGILIAATELFLTKLNLREWVSKVNPHVQAHILPSAAAYYRNSAAAPSTSAAPNNETVVSNFCKSVEQVRNQHAEKLATCFVVRTIQPYVAVKVEEYQALLKSTASDNRVDFPSLRMVNGTKNAQVKFQGQSKWALCVPVSAFSASQMRLLRDEELLSDSDVEPVHDKCPVGPHSPTPKKPLLSPFKSAAQTTQPGSVFAETQPPAAPPSAPCADDLEEVEENSDKDSAKHFSMGLRKRKAIPVGSPDSSILAASFSVTEKETDDTTKAEDIQTTAPLSKKVPCAGCHNVKAPNNVEKTFLCHVCKKRFHRNCQSIDAKWWPDSAKTHGLRCEQCRLP